MADATLATQAELDRRWTEAAESHPPLLFTPAWWQERLLDWATAEPDFRVKLLRFVDVLPTLRSASAVADHVRQYFGSDAPAPVQLASGLASQPVFRPVLSRVVREGVFAMAHRFIAGASPEEALPRLRDLAREGTAATVDLLGEATLSHEEADTYLARYTSLLEALSAGGDSLRPRSDVWAGVPPVNISIKLSALCAHLKPAAPEHTSACIGGRLRPLLRRARELGAYVHVDMEQYRYKDLVHHAFADAVLDPEFADFADIGIVVQAYLRDAAADVARIRALAERRGTPITVRLVKGAYWDEERIVAGQLGWPSPVFESKHDTDESYERCTDALLAAWPHLRPAFGTHNPSSAAQAAVKAHTAGLRAQDIEFQTLYGMAEGLREAIAADGYRTRVYAPVGEVIPGMAYLVRRLLENTSNQAWFAGLPAGGADGASGPRSDSATTTAAVTDPGENLTMAFQNTPVSRFFEAETRERMSRAIAAARRSFGATYPLLIGPHRILDRELDDVRYPAEPDTVIGHVAQGTPADVEAAVAAARDAFPAWRDTPADERADLLRSAAGLMLERRFELAAIEVFESAKPWEEADADVAEAIDYLRYYADEAERLSAPRPMGNVPGEDNAYFHEGRGVAAIIAPWNFPLAIITGMGSAALAAGDCAILKPAGQSPIIAFMLADILREAGVPPEVVQYLPGPGGAVGQALVEHTDVDIIAFTGSSAVGQGILAAAAQVRPGQRNIKRVIAEMGGKNAIIIDDDADLDQAVEGVVVSAFGYAGQKCSAASRLVIVGSAYDETVERLRNAVASLVVGPPDDPATFVPPVIGAGVRDKIMRYVEIGRETCTLLAQRDPPPGPGSYVPPTVFADVPPDSSLAREEIFGPVLSVFRAKDFDEALAIATDSAYALTGGLFSRNPRNIERARREFRVGNLYINRKVTGAMVGRQPFGGLAMSGVGEKAGGPDYVRQFMQPRVVTENTMRRGFAPEGELPAGE